MADSATYPTRERFFALRFTRLMTKRALAQEVGALAVLMLVVIVHQEDACHYRRGVTFYDAQFMFLLGINSKKTMTKIRKQLTKAGWLHYEPGHKGKASTYWVLTPADVEGLDDKPTDESYDECGSLKEPNNKNTVPLGNLNGVDREPKGGLFIPIPIPDPNTPCEHVSKREGEEERPYSQQHDLKNALVLPPIVTERLRAYLPGVQQRAWSITHRFREFCPGRQGTAMMADFAAVFADVVLEGGEEWLSTYFTPRDAVQIEAEVKAGRRLPPNASPWDIAKLYRTLHKKPGGNGRPVVVPSNPTTADPTIEHIQQRKAEAEKKAAKPGAFTKGLRRPKKLEMPQSDQVTEGGKLCR